MSRSRSRRKRFSVIARIVQTSRGSKLVLIKPGLGKR